MVVQLKTDGLFENVEQTPDVPTTQHESFSADSEKTLRVSGAPIRVSEVSKNYGLVTAIRSASFEVGEGEVIALLGPSGCGKTTLLRCVAGLEGINGGSIEIGNTLVSSNMVNVPPERRDVGFVFQSYALWPHLSVAQNVEYGLKVARRPAAEIRSLVGDILDLVGLTGYAGRMPGELSGGQQQRVALARSLVVRPRVLLLDEPLSNLDASLRDRMRQEIRQLLKQVGITAVFVTHDQREAFAISDRVVLMNAGLAVQVDTPEALYARPATVFAATFLGGANIVPITDFQLTTGNIASARNAEIGALRGSDSRPGNSVPGYAMFRPEDVQIAAKTDGEAFNSWEGTVVERTFEGSYVELVAQSGPCVVRVLGRHHAAKVGDRIALQVSPDHLLFLSE